jgi:phage terminase small subunit
MANPMVGQINRLDTEIRHLEVEFGLTPAARARLGLTEVQRQSRLDEMMRRQREA